MYFTKLVRQYAIDDFDWNLLADYEWLVIVNVDDLVAHVQPATIHAMRATAGQARDALFVFCEPHGTTAAAHLAVLERLGAVFTNAIDTTRAFILLIPTTAFSTTGDAVEYEVRYLDRGDPARPDPDDRALDVFDETLERLRESARTELLISGGKSALRSVIEFLWQELIKTLATGTPGLG